VACHMVFGNRIDRGTALEGLTQAEPITVENRDYHHPVGLWLIDAVIDMWNFGQRQMSGNATNREVRVLSHFPRWGIYTSFRSADWERSSMRRLIS
jgi:hypothetical protein